MISRCDGAAKQGSDYVWMGNWSAAGVINNVDRLDEISRT